MTRTFILVLLCIIISFITTVPGSNVYSSKRGRPQYSSLIPFPRVGRSGSGGTGTRDLMYYGQKRGGKSGLIPFPRVGRGGANTWDLGSDTSHHKYDGDKIEFATVPSKRQSLIPFPRVGKRQVDNTYHRRLLRSQESQLWHKRDDFKRRITKRSSWGKSRSFDRRILRSTPGYGDGGEFKRRITRSWDDATHAPEMMVRKRQSLIPFPRTGKRSGSTESSNRELNQVYVYDSPQEDDEDPETEPEPEPEDDEDEDEFDTLDDDDLVFEDELDDLDDDSLGASPFRGVVRAARIPVLAAPPPGSFYHDY